MSKLNNLFKNQSTNTKQNNNANNLTVKYNHNNNNAKNDCTNFNRVNNDNLIDDSKNQKFLRNENLQLKNKENDKNSATLNNFNNDNYSKKQPNNKLTNKRNKNNKRSEERNNFFNQLSEKLVKSNTSQIRFRVVEVDEVKPIEQRTLPPKNQKIHSEEIKDVEYIVQENNSLSKISEHSNISNHKYIEEYVEQEKIIDENSNQINNKVDLKEYYKELKTYFNIFKAKAKEVVRNYKNINEVQGNCYNDSLESLEDFNYNNQYTVESNDNILYSNQTLSNNNDNYEQFVIESFYIEIEPNINQKNYNYIKDLPGLNELINNAVNERVNQVLSQSNLNLYFFN